MSSFFRQVVQRELISRGYTFTLRVMRNDVSWKSFLLIRSSRVSCFVCSCNVKKAKKLMLGHYRAMLWKEDSKTWTIDPALGIHVGVEVCSLSCLSWKPQRGRLTGRKCLLGTRSSTQEDHQMGGSHSHLTKLVRLASRNKLTSRRP